jgi:protein-S-isoprenylcysteine O-methyltransferase Ste14
VHHSVMARAGAKAWIARHVPAAYERSIYVWIASVLLILVTLGWQRVPGLVYAAPAPWAWLLVALQGAGLILTLAAARVLSATDLAGIRQAARRPAPTDVRVVWALLVLAAPVMTVDRLWWALVTTSYLVIAIPWEERSLSAVAGPAYQAYRQRVRWRMVPGLY